ncbi:S41 family peptidase [Nodosilinea nodulosa]|uniref:S41 family peptidase n=1 Tax=Nodosilinea nodulosa TaxID=416001 RepID=UPI000592DFC6|nr:S41 family peptidase [Nodosilinea nodulosa]
MRPSILAFVPLALVAGAAKTTLAATPLAEFKDSPKVVIDEAWQIIDQEYVDGDFNHVDWQAVRQELLGREYSSQEAAYTALRSALRRLDDPYTRFLSPTEYADLTDQTSGEISGIGVQLERNDQSGVVLVTSVTPGSPAEQSGIVVGDRILLVDGQSTERLTAEGVLQQLRGSEGSQVTLTVSRDSGASRTVILTRALMDLPTVEYSQKTVGDRSIGYIRLIEFNAHAAAQMSAAIRSLSDAGVEGFVLDLRGNPGGLLMASIDIGRMWLQHGAIVRTLDRSSNDETISANRTALTDLPLTVLVDGRSASSSEILTGALRDNNRATVVGTPTYGKALVQSLHGLNDGSGLTVTVAHYYTPNGTDISRRGITPDVAIALSDRQRRELFSNPALLGTEADTQYLRAAEVLEQTILASERQPEAGASRLGRVTPAE